MRESGTHLRLHALPGTGHVGYATTRTIGSRPLRNRARRRMAEALRAAGLADQPNRDRIIMVKHIGAAANLPELADELRALHDRIDARWEDASES